MKYVVDGLKRNPTGIAPYGDTKKMTNKMTHVPLPPQRLLRDPPPSPRARVIPAMWRGHGAVRRRHQGVLQEPPAAQTNGQGSIEPPQERRHGQGYVQHGEAGVHAGGCGCCVQRWRGECLVFFTISACFGVFEGVWCCIGAVRAERVFAYLLT